MATISNEFEVKDFSAWKVSFDKNDHFRKKHKIEALRVLQNQENPNKVFVLLRFATPKDATAFSQDFLLDSKDQEVHGVIPGTFKRSIWNDNEQIIYKYN